MDQRTDHHKQKVSKTIYIDGRKENQKQETGSEEFINIQGITCNYTEKGWLLILLKHPLSCNLIDIFKGSYLVTRIVHRRVIRLSMRGLMTSKGSLGRPKNPRVACKK